MRGKGIDSTTSIVKLAVPAAAVAVYHVSADELAGMKGGIKGMTLKDARMFIAKQPGIDTQTIVVKVSYGDTIPTYVQQIKMVLIPANAVNLSPVQLPTIQAVAMPNT